VLPLAERVRGAATVLADEFATSATALDVFVVEVDKVISAVAITPLEIAFAFVLHTKHVKPPEDGLQVTDLPGAVSAAPGLTLTTEKSAAV
jgi:hypothetical protein